MFHWTNEKCLELIDLYKKHTVLWNPSHPHHYSKIKKTQAWQSIADEMEMDLAVIKQKMASLLGSFRSQICRFRKWSQDGTGRDISECKWFALEALNFLLNKNGSEIEDIKNEHTPTPKPKIVRIEAQKRKSNIEDNASIIRKNQRIHETNSVDDNTRLESPKETVTHCSASSTNHDRFDIYGQHIANKLRMYSTITEAVVEFKINNILFEADMGKYEQSEYSATPVEAPN